MGIYAALGIPELWRFDGQVVEGLRSRRGPALRACPQQRRAALPPAGGSRTNAGAGRGPRERCGMAPRSPGLAASARATATINRPAPPTDAPNGAEGQDHNHLAEVGLSYVLNTPDDQRAMLAAIGVASIEELFAQHPAEPASRIGRWPCPPALSEIELTRHVQQLAGAQPARPATPSASWAAAATTISSPPSSMPSPAAANSTPPTRPTRPRPARAACRRSSSSRR